MKVEHYKIIHLPKEQWKNAIIPMRYTTEEYYDVEIEKNVNGFYADFTKKKFNEPVTHYPEEHDFPDKLYQEHWEKACAWGIGIGHELMAIAKEQANLEHRRAIILETQSCNVPAISFYLKEGFELIGFDSCCYSNKDVDKREVRLDLGYFPKKVK